MLQILEIENDPTGTENNLRYSPAEVTILMTFLFHLHLLSALFLLNHPQIFPSIQ